MKSSKESLRHHYIPKFYIKGFTNESGFLWVYDKKADKIINKQQSPKSVFFENNLNTLTIRTSDADHKVTKLEDRLSLIDNEVSKYIVDLRTKDVNVIEDELPHIAYLQMFISQLFWRTINPNPLRRELFEFYKVNHGDWKTFEIEEQLDFLDERDKVHFLKSLLPYEILRNLKPEKGKDFIKIIEIEKSSFLLNDNPTIFENIPTDKLGLKSLIFPISKKRLYVSLRGLNYDFAGEDVLLFNLIQIYQADKYVGGPSKDELVHLVELYKKISVESASFFDDLKATLFSRINVRN